MKYFLCPFACLVVFISFFAPSPIVAQNLMEQAGGIPLELQISSAGEVLDVKDVYLIKRAELIPVTDGGAGVSSWHLSFVSPQLLNRAEARTDFRLNSYYCFRFFDAKDQELAVVYSPRRQRNRGPLAYEQDAVNQYFFDLNFQLVPLQLLAASHRVDISTRRESH